MSRTTSLLVATVCLLLLPFAIACSGDEGGPIATPTPDATAGASLDAWATGFCDVLMSFGRDISGASSADPVAYMEAIAAIARRTGRDIDALPKLPSTRAFQAATAGGMTGLEAALLDSIPRMRSAIAARDAEALTVERVRITSAIEALQSTLSEAPKTLPAQALTALNLVPGCLRPNLLNPDTTG